METPHSTFKRIMSKNEITTQQSHYNSTKFEIGQPVIVKNHAHHNFKPKYLLDYKVKKYLMTAHFCL